MMDLATLTNAPKRIELDGGVYVVSALTVGEWGGIQGWIKQNVPGPLRSINSLDLDGLDQEDRTAVLNLARREQKHWPPRVGSPAWLEALDHPGGHAEFIRVALSKHNDVTPERAKEMADRLTIGDVVPLLAAALGLDDSDPKPERDRTPN